jgi:hypothetical protein
LQGFVGHEKPGESPGAAALCWFYFTRCVKRLGGGGEEKREEQGAYREGMER